ncbi:bifunctional levopimaradiene synthase, chloroplastic-like [Typha angustifolia]|uniref:bifunctional levopimaradiene synthase, chloroplastic-like n=1 Tax=Typha angustifolia TaxID=59011 RepID=UPI003C2D3812
MNLDLLEYFKDDDDNFVCFHGQTHRGVSDMFNLYRYSQLAFPGEKILKEAKAFVQDYLRTCVANNQVSVDKWSLKKSLDKEVAHALEVPWRTSFERLEAREYIDQYGENDVWIAKTVYKMSNVNDPKYLELAKLDYNRLQKLYKSEIDSILKWWNDCGILDDHLVVNVWSPEEIHFGIAATLYEPEFSACRIAYTKCNCIENALRALFEFHESTEDLSAMYQAVKKWDPSLVHSLPLPIKATFTALYDTMNDLAAQASTAQGKDMFNYLHDLRLKQMQHYMNIREQRRVLQDTTLKQYIEQGKGDLGVAMRLLPSMFIMGERLSNHAFGCLDERSAIQDRLSSFLSLFAEVQKHKNSSNKDNDRDAVYFYMKEKSCTEQEAISYLNAMMEDTFDELVHECLKSSLVPRSCRRLMLEHARVTQFFLTHELSNESTRREVIDNAMDRMFTPILVHEQSL